VPPPWMMLPVVTTSPVPLIFPLTSRFPFTERTAWWSVSDPLTVRLCSEMESEEMVRSLVGPWI
jgi:hypothetical protein